MAAREVRLILSNDVSLGTGRDGSVFRKAWTLYTLDGQPVGQFDPAPDSDDPPYNGWHDNERLARLMSEGE